jgi:hypothetical protein
VTYDRVYRHNGPNKGRLCRIVARQPQRRDWLGKGELYTGEAMIGVEFQDGRRELVQRQAVVLAASRLGRQAVKNAKVQTPDQRRARNQELQMLWRERQRP